MILEFVAVNIKKENKIMTSLNKVRGELQTIAKDLNFNIEADKQIQKGAFGRAIRKLEAGVQKLGHLFATLIQRAPEFKTKQERSLSLIDKQLAVVKEELEATAKDYKEHRHEYRNELGASVDVGFKDFTDQINGQLLIMKRLCSIIGEKTDKINKDEVDKVQKEIDSLIESAKEQIGEVDKNIREGAKPKEQVVKGHGRQLEELMAKKKPRDEAVAELGKREEARYADKTTARNKFNEDVAKLPDKIEQLKPKKLSRNENAQWKETMKNLEAAIKETEKTSDEQLPILANTVRGYLNSLAKLARKEADFQMLFTEINQDLRTIERV